MIGQQQSEMKKKDPDSEDLSHVAPIIKVLASINQIGNPVLVFCLNTK